MHDSHKYNLYPSLGTHQHKTHSHVNNYASHNQTCIMQQQQLPSLLGIHETSRDTQPNHWRMRLRSSNSGPSSSRHNLTRCPDTEWAFPHPRSSKLCQHIIHHHVLTRCPDTEWGVASPRGVQNMSQASIHHNMHDIIIRCINLSNNNIQSIKHASLLTMEA